LTSPLNDLTHRLTMLAAPYRCTITVRLLGGPRGGAVVAADFIREARVALSGAPPIEQTVTRARLRRARR
jgi:hypothetical protein